MYIKFNTDMKKVILTSLLSIFTLVLVHGGLKPGDKAVPFSLKNVDGKTVSLSDYSSQKGVLLQKHMNNALLIFITSMPTWAFLW
jgi:hypothetical protein